MNILNTPFHSEKHVRLGNAKGELVGGNLSILYSLFGSPSAIDCSDKILFIGRFVQYLYHIDRMMMNLKRNGCLESLKGIIVGGMTKMKDNDIPGEKMRSKLLMMLPKTTIFQ